MSFKRLIYEFNTVDFSANFPGIAGSIFTFKKSYSSFQDLFHEVS